jgi:hypothetical protein
VPLGIVDTVDVATPIENRKLGQQIRSPFAE